MKAEGIFYPVKAKNLKNFEYLVSKNRFFWKKKTQKFYAKKSFDKRTLQRSIQACQVQKASARILLHHLLALSQTLNKKIFFIKMSDAPAAAPATPKAAKVAKLKKVAAKKAPSEHPKVIPTNGYFSS